MTGVSTLGQALSQMRNIKNQQTLFAKLATQLATGKRTQVFSELGTDVLTTKRARADFKSLDTYINNIKNANRRIDLTVKTVEEFKKQAQNLHNALLQFSEQSAHQQGDIVYYDDPLTVNEIEQIPVGYTSGDPDTDLAVLRNLASSIKPFLEDLLNRRDGDRYLLAGADNLTQPYNSTGLLGSAVSSLISQWKTGSITTDDLIADFSDRTTSGGNADALTDSIVGYSSTLSSGNAGKVFVRVEEGAEIDFTALANDKSFRDILVAVYAIENENLPPIADVYIPPNAYPAPPDINGAPGDTLDEMKENFFSFIAHIRTSVSRAIDDIDQVLFNLQGVQSRMSGIKDQHTNQKNLLLNTIGDVEDVDLNDVALKINTLQIQLDASFRVTARLQELSLTQFF